MGRSDLRQTRSCIWLVDLSATLSVYKTVEGTLYINKSFTMLVILCFYLKYYYFNKYVDIMKHKR